MFSEVRLSPLLFRCQQEAFGNSTGEIFSTLLFASWPVSTMAFWYLEQMQFYRKIVIVLMLLLSQKPLYSLPPKMTLKNYFLGFYSSYLRHILIVSCLLLLLSCFSRVRLCATPYTAAHQAPPSLGFSRQEHWSGLPFPSPMHESEKWKWSRSVVSDSSRPHGLQPTRLLHPWDFPGKSTGVGCHCLLR